MLPTYRHQKENKNRIAINRELNLVQIEKKYIDFLKLHGATDIKHSGEDLLGHLKGTFKILVDWELSEHVCFSWPISFCIWNRSI